MPPRLCLAVLEGEEMLRFRTGSALYPYCSDCQNAAYTPVTGVLGCTVGDDPVVLDYSNRVFQNQVNQDLERCPGYISSLAATPGEGAPIQASTYGAVIRPLGAGTYTVELAGQEIGRANVAFDGNGNYLTSVRLDPQFQRRGIGTALYDYIEQHLGRKLQPSPQYLTPAARSFWQKRQRNAAQAGMVKEVPSTLSGRSDDDWEDLLGEALQEVHKDHPDAAIVIEHAVQELNDRGNYSTQDAERYYNYAVPSEEWESLVDKERGKHGVLDEDHPTVEDPAERAAFYDFLKHSGLTADTPDGLAMEIIAKAMLGWRDGLMAGEVTDNTLRGILADFRLGNY